MLYFNALLNGLAVLPEANPAIRAKLDQDLERLGKEACINDSPRLIH